MYDLKWRELPTEVIYHIKGVDHIKMRSGGMPMAVRLVDENETSFNPISTGLFANLKRLGAFCHPLLT